MSQVNFFMLPEDEDDFVEVLAAREDTRVFPAHGLDIPATLHSNGLTLFNRKLGGRSDGRSFGEYPLGAILGDHDLAGMAPKRTLATAATWEMTLA
jgi:hypothetical protein